jgi:copper chaperone CopZ
MTSTVIFSVEGMQCDACASKLQTALSSQPGVQELSVSFKDRQARVVYESSATNVNRLEAAIHEAGFKTPVGCP